MAPPARLHADAAGLTSSTTVTGVDGRAERRRAVRDYLEALEATRWLRASAHQVKANLVLLEARVDRGDPLARLQLVQRRRDLLAAGAQAERLAAAEAAFIAVARDYSAEEAITYEAWRQVGVDARVLRAAGVANTPRRPPAQAPVPRDHGCALALLRCWLLLLVGEAPRHGYELCEALAADIGVVDRSRVYRVLHRLDAEGLVASQWQASNRWAPQCRVYSLAPAGEEALDACAAGVAELRRALRSHLAH